MGYESMTDARIAELRALPKRVTNPRGKLLVKSGTRFEQANYIAINANAATLESASARFTIYWRRSTMDSEDFSCGIAWDAPDGTALTLARYNGANHKHPPAFYQCHIHQATERAIREGRSPEFYAEISTRYSTVEGALHCLLTDFAVSGLPSAPDQPDLFLTP
jgi:hypothetical protein